MVLLYDATGTYNTQWARAIPTGIEATTASDLRAYDALNARATGVVAFVPDQGDPALIQRLQTLRTSYPLKFLIILRATPDSPPLPVAADATLCVTTTVPALWAIIQNVESNGLLQRLAGIVRSAATMPVMLRLALVHVLLRPTPIVSIKELAAEVNCERRTLPRAWELYFTEQSDRLIDFLDWIMLLYATGRKTPKRSWTLISRDVGVAEETLARGAKRLLGVTLSELAPYGQAPVLAKFAPVFERLFGRWPDHPSPETFVPRPLPRILVVDDHDAIRQFLHHTLSRAGFQVTTANTGDEALRQLDRTPELPTVVLTDVKMPGMDGIELARRIARRWPSVQLVLMSAFISIDGVQLDWLREDLSQWVRFLSKPFSAGRVIALLREACDFPSGS